MSTSSALSPVRPVVVDPAPAPRTSWLAVAGVWLSAGPHVAVAVVPFDWRWLNLVLMAAAFPGAALSLVAYRRTRHRGGVDRGWAIAGLALAAASVGRLVIGLLLLPVYVALLMGLFALGQ